MLPEKKNCTGCGACAAICPKQAVTMAPDRFGLLFPKIDASLCVHCGLCEKACPCLAQPNRCEIKKIYGVAASDEAVRIQSSSGGLFSLLAGHVLENGGVVCGCRMDDDCRNCRHVLIDDISGLPLLRGSKYIQSDTGAVFAEIKRLLEAGKFVLFSGTPCQAAGLKTFLGKPYGTLFVMDVICHGVAAPLIWQKYLDHAEAAAGAKAQSVSFRDKTNGWHGFSVKIGFENGESSISPIAKDLFMLGYLENLYLRQSCYRCPFRGEHYYSDLTAADFWGLNVAAPALDDDKGVSLAVCHTQEALGLLQTVLPRAAWFETDEENAFRQNPAYYRSPRPNLWRGRAMAAFARRPFYSVAGKYCGASVPAKIRRKLSFMGSSAYLRILHAGSRGAEGRR